MSQADYFIANASGAVVRADLNDQFGAIATLNSGIAAPSITFANMWWFDTVNDTLFQRNEANTAWVKVAQKDGTGWTPYRQEVLTGTASVKDHGTIGDTIPKNDTANVYSAIQKIVDVTSGPTEGPIWEMHRDNSSPGDFDLGPHIRFQGENDNDEKITYAKIGMQLIDVSDGVESGAFVIDTYLAGVFTRRWNFSASIHHQGTPGGVPAAGFINCAGYEIDGVSIPLTQQFASGDLTIPTSSNVQIAHGLGQVPILVHAVLRCTITQHGYSVGDEIPVAACWELDEDTSAVTLPVTPFSTATNVGVANGATIYIGLKSTGVLAAITFANWRYRIRAWI